MRSFLYFVIWLGINPLLQVHFCLASPDTVSYPQQAYRIPGIETAGTHTGPKMPAAIATSRTQTLPAYEDCLTLEEAIQKNGKGEGLAKNLLDGITLLYYAVSNLLLYPVFSFLLFLMTIILIIIAVAVVRKLKQGSLYGRMQLFSLLYIFIYLDLFLIVFEDQKIVYSFLEFEKDIFLIMLSALTGFIAGKYTSKKSFEEEKMP